MFHAIVFLIIQEIVMYRQNYSFNKGTDKEEVNNNGNISCDFEIHY